MNRRTIFALVLVTIVYLVAAAAASAQSFRSKDYMTQPTAAQPSAKDEIRPFRVNFSNEALADLKRRIAATKWPSQELVKDGSQGVQLATMKKLAEYWETYDWRKTEAKLNSYPQFITNID